MVSAMWIVRTLLVSSLGCKTAALLIVLAVFETHDYVYSAKVVIYDEDSVERRVKSIETPGFSKQNAKVLATDYKI